jgi:tRNA threonylcarbamoyladenosine biosynthesis protein TsaB
MNVLAFDTCFGACSVALRWRSAKGEWLLREEYEERQTGHAEALMPMIERVLEGGALKVSAIDRIAVTYGPGTFTGVRIGVAAARGLALAARKPVVGLSSLAVMACRADALLGKPRGERPLAICVDARKGQVYAQLFGENAGDPLSEPLLLAPREVVALTGASPFVVAGSGAEAVAAMTREAGVAVDAVLPRLEPHARFLAILAPILQPLSPVRPLYLRAPDARPPQAQALPRAGTD